MQFTNLFVSFLLSSAVYAKGNSTKNADHKVKAVTDKSLCNEMQGLEAIVKLASNTTKLSKKLKANETKIAEFTAKADTAATTLKTMQSNTTLVSTCAVIDSAEKVKQTCNVMKDLQKTVELAANTTKLSTKLKANATKIAEFTKWAATADEKLKTLMSNSTLVSTCSDLAASKKESGTKAATSSAASASASAKSAANAKTAGGVLSAVVVIAMGSLFL